MSAFTDSDDLSHHRQLHYIYSALVGSLHVSASSLNKMSKHRGRQVPEWILYCKNLHAEGKKKMLKRCRNCLLHIDEVFGAIKTARAVFENALEFWRKN